MKHLLHKSILLIFTLITLAACGGGGGGGNSGTPNADDLILVKEFVTDVRTWGTVIKGSAGEADAFNLQIDMANTTFDLFGQSLFTALDHATQIAFDAYSAGEAASANLADYPLMNGIVPVVATGSVAIVGNSITVDGIIDDQAVYLEIDVPASSVGTQFNLTVVTATVSNPYAEIDITAGEINIEFEGVDVDITEAILPDFTSADFKLTATISETNILDSEFGVNDPVTFEGNIEAGLLVMRNADGSIYKDITYNEADYNPTEIILTGEFRNTTGDSYEAALVATMHNATTFTSVTTLTGEDENAANFRNITLSLTFTAQLEGLPEAVISLTANRNAFRAGNVDFTISYGTREIKAAVGVSEDALGNVDADGSITITNADGMRMVITLEKSTGADGNDIIVPGLTYNGAEYATITEDDTGILIIRYYDGTFETL